MATNMYPRPGAPALGRFVSDQVAALRRIDGIDVEVFSFPGGSPASYVRAGAEARRRYRGRRFDVVHAHFGLSAWPALAVAADAHAVTLHGTDLAHPRSRAITVAALPWLDLIGVVSAELSAQVPALLARGRVQVLPCGVDLSRFSPMNRHAARRALGLEPEARYVLFPADPARPEKRVDLARALMAQVGALGTSPADDALKPTLLSLGGVAPERVPLYVNAANAVVIPSDREGFGLALLEALACDVPVLATPHGVARDALAGVEGCLCAPFSLPAWSSVLERHLAGEDPRVQGRSAALRFSAEAMAQRVAASWRELALDARARPRG